MDDTQLCFPQLNSSCIKPRRPHTQAVLLHILLSSISLLTTALNLLVIVSISHFKKLHSPTNLLLLSLAVSDFFVGILMSFQIILADGCWFLGDAVCMLYCALDYVVTSASVGTMVLISVDRYVAICDPLHYPTKVTMRRATVCTSLCWACSFLYNGVLLKDNLKQPGRYNSCSGECVVVISDMMGVADLILTFIGPVTVIIVLYGRVFVVAVSQARVIRSHTFTLQGPQTVYAKRSELKAVRTLDQSSVFDVTSVPLELWLFYFNSCLNPIIYAFCYPWFLKSVKLIVTLKIFEPESCEASVL
ncbi:trace amine-associated receptor 13c-like [Stegastes partitus]|uniref:Trace amine-associated receptor 13c-like n=1 Tax=Stegastes partitus TaxID=144197 RepID=A0A9Y4ND87_9TELE|nr:PREDICTED: trace amine-associated receptor 13c-like [Stegastes partitus]